MTPTIAAMQARVAAAVAAADRDPHVVAAVARYAALAR